MKVEELEHGRAELEDTSHLSALIIIPCAAPREGWNPPDKPRWPRAALRLEGKATAPGAALGRSRGCSDRHGCPSTAGRIPELQGKELKSVLVPTPLRKGKIRT